MTTIKLKGKTLKWNGAAWVCKSPKLARLAMDTVPDGFERDYHPDEGATRAKHLKKTLGAVIVKIEKDEVDGIVVY